MDDPVQRAFIVDANFLAKSQKKRAHKRTSMDDLEKKVRHKGRRVGSTALRDCSTCQLDKNCTSPKMQPYGEGKLGIVIVGESPGKTEDQRGRPFVGESGRVLRKTLSDFDIDMDRDCLVTNAVQCKPPDQKTAAKLKVWADCCRARLEAQITEFKPGLIITLGADAARAVLRPGFDPTSGQVRGLQFPSVKYGCWVGCCWHPSFILRDGEDSERLSYFQDDIAEALDLIDKDIPKLLPDDNYIVLDEMWKVDEFFKSLNQSKDPVAFDFETNAILPYAKDAKIYCCSFALTPDDAYFLPLQFKKYWTTEQLDEVMWKLGDWLKSDCPKVIQSYAMEQKWASAILGVNVKNLCNDTMISSHVLDERKKINSLEFQAFRATGVVYKDKVDVTAPDWAENHEEKLVQKHSAQDSQYTCLIHEAQMKNFKCWPTLYAGSKFFLRCLPALVRMEMRGIAVDKPLLLHQKESALARQKECENFFENSKFVETFRKETSRAKWNPGSSKDFVDLFYRILKIKPPPWRTTGGGLPADKEALVFILPQIKDPEFKEFCDKLTLWGKLDTLITTFIAGAENAIQDDGLIHPSFLLHTVESYRSSSANPNFQNQAKREEEHSEFRMIYIPHIGNSLTECDASGSEVATIGMLSRDAVLVEQIKKKFDSHAYWAAKLYECSIDKVTKLQRFLSKNKFVFPEFYGSWYRTCAPDLGLPEAHVKKVEAEFWAMYTGVKKWQKVMIDFYNKHRYVEMPMGFRRHGPLSRNQILNTKVQGTSFHMLLQSLFRADEEMTKKEMKSGMVCEVHDSLVTDTVEEEKDDVCKIMKIVMEEKQFDWQYDIPRRCDISNGPNWGQMEEVKL